jgi:hypothetical protein
MARARLNEVIQRYDTTLNKLVPVPGASVQVYQLDTTTAITETMYAAASGTTTKSNPLTADSNGVVQAYRSKPGPVTLSISASSITTVTSRAEFTPDASDDPVSVKDYGATGDGMTDDFAAIMAAYSAATGDIGGGGVGGIIDFPHGKYLVSQPLVFNSYGLHVRGAGGGISNQSHQPAYGTRLKSVDGMASVLEINGGGVVLEGVTIDGSNAAGAQSALIGLRLRGLYYSTIRDVSVEGCVVGVSLEDELYSDTLQNVTVVRCGTGFYGHRTGAAAIQKVTFVNCSAEFCTIQAVLLSRAELFTFLGGAFQSSVIGAKMTNSAPTFTSRVSISRATRMWASSS